MFYEKRADFEINQLFFFEVSVILCQRACFMSKSEMFAGR